MAATIEVPFLCDPAGREHVLALDTVTIGRAVENDIVITSRRVSREHARIERQGRRRVLFDLGSTNGTFFNDERLMAPVELRNGDRIQIGDVVLTFHDPESTSLDSPFPDLDIDEAAALVRVDRRVVSLSPKEFSLLSYLYAHAGEVRSKDEIAAAVWPEYESGIYDYQIENLVRRLRERIEPQPSEPQLLITVRGQGYKLVVPRQA
ncbi:MAG: winged helix-turn-helix domain-containing protein [Anaerolineae bacterium]|nr:winged helix-turn-helix domain-containing protein [Anaerolineae bacterium]